MLSLAFVLGGCGDSTKQETSGSQLDDEGATGITTVHGTDTSGTTAGGEGSVMVDYQWDQCTLDMNKRYGDLETAKKVCAELQSNYGSSPMSELSTILPGVEASVNATALPGSTIPGSSSGGTSGGSSGGSPSGGSSGGGSGGSSGGGWDSGGIEIVVPQGPGGSNGPSN